MEVCRAGGAQLFEITSAVAEGVSGAAGKKQEIVELAIGKNLCLLACHVEQSR
jgi:hypothetical protein